MLIKKSYAGTYIVALMTLVLAITGCDLSLFSNTEDAEKIPVARVYDKYLYEEDIRLLISPGTSHADSASLAKNHIENWIRKNVILHKAENNLSDSQKEVERQMLEYRNSLITFIYEKELINQQLDTLIDEAEIELYYNENKRNFELKDNIVKVVYLKTKKNAPKLKLVKKWIRSGKEKDRLKLEEYCYQFASDFNLDDETWMLFDDLLKKTPIKTHDKESFLRHNKYVEVQDSTDIYLIYIWSRQIRDSISPLSFVTDDIRNLIINKRKLELINEMENDAYQQALMNGDFEIYEDN
jgi:hypothetical protein